MIHQICMIMIIQGVPKKRRTGVVAGNWLLDANECRFWKCSFLDSLSIEIFHRFYFRRSWHGHRSNRPHSALKVLLCILLFFLRNRKQTLSEFHLSKLIVFSGSKAILRMRSGFKIHWLFSESTGYAVQWTKTLVIHKLKQLFIIAFI